jgi:hypothetical protein
MGGLNCAGFAIPPSENAFGWDLLQKNEKRGEEIGPSTR